ncbi:hypothetical protein D9611_010192 [Ephemerocybe angulata]|uniref:PH domain-containing protein n=1 Tax=Ephemerocybe angulata TaxID=980116 RepID=A0A8H5AYX7_9AGAR|nr:hypothetical protein D9611_010192 [Tulosesus angulatus]
MFVSQTSQISNAELELERGPRSGYAPVDPFKASVSLGIRKILGRTKDRTIDEIPIEPPAARPLEAYHRRSQQYRRASRHPPLPDPSPLWHPHPVNYNAKPASHGKETPSFVNTPNSPRSSPVERLPSRSSGGGEADTRLTYTPSLSSRSTHTPPLRDYLHYGAPKPLHPTRPEPALSYTEPAQEENPDARRAVGEGDMTQSTGFQGPELPKYVGLLWYLNIDTHFPTYRWERCIAFLYPDSLFLTWESLGPDGNSETVEWTLDLSSCKTVASVPALTHPSARDDIGTISARDQNHEGILMEGREGLELIEILVPFHLVYSDTTERIATESLGERVKWVSALWDVLNDRKAASPSSSDSDSISGAISASTVALAPPISLTVLDLPSVPNTESQASSPRTSICNSSESNVLSLAPPARNAEDTAALSKEPRYVRYASMCDPWDGCDQSPIASSVGLESAEDHSPGPQVEEERLASTARASVDFSCVLEQTLENPSEDHLESKDIAVRSRAERYNRRFGETFSNVNHFAPPPAARHRRSSSLGARPVTENQKRWKRWADAMLTTQALKQDAFLATTQSPQDHPYEGRHPLDYVDIEETVLTIAMSLFLDVIPRQLYLYFLLHFPALYFSRVTRIFRDANMGMGEIKKMALDAVESGGGASRMLIYNGIFPQEDKDTPAEYVNLRTSWHGFVDSLLREWKMNIISVLLLSAILTILQIEAAAANPLTRYTALTSLVCAFMSLLYGCIYIIRFGTMRKAYKAAEWANESERSSTSIFWNVWVMLAMPAVWLGWSMTFYIICVMSFVWQTGPTSSPSTVSPVYLPSDPQILIPRIIISLFLGLGVFYLILIAITFRRYGDPMEEAWRERIRGWMQEKASANQPANQSNSVYLRQGHAVSKENLPKDVSNSKGADGKTNDLSGHGAPTRPAKVHWASRLVPKMGLRTPTGDVRGLGDLEKGRVSPAPVPTSMAVPEPVSLTSQSLVGKSVEIARQHGLEHARSDEFYPSSNLERSKPASVLLTSRRSELPAAMTKRNSNNITGNATPSVESLQASQPREGSTSAPQASTDTNTPLPCLNLFSPLQMSSMELEPDPLLEEECPHTQCVEYWSIPVVDGENVGRGDIEELEQILLVYDTADECVDGSSTKPTSPGLLKVTSMAPVERGIIGQSSWEGFIKSIRGLACDPAAPHNPRPRQLVKALETWNREFETFGVQTVLVKLREPILEPEGSAATPRTPPDSCYGVYLCSSKATKVEIVSSYDLDPGPHGRLMPVGSYHLVCEHRFRADLEVLDIVGYRLGKVSSKEL